MKIIKIISIFPLLFFLSLKGFASSPLAPIKRDTPRATMKSYMTAMNEYLLLMKKGERSKALLKLSDAAKTLNLEGLPLLVQKEEGRRKAKLLKEVIDRVIVIDFNKVPDDPKMNYWRLKDTEITIRKIKSGDQAGLFLFSKDTVRRLDEFYQKVKHLPYLKGTTGGALYKEPFTKRYIPEWAQEHFWGLEKWQWFGILIAILFGYIIKLFSRLTIALIRKLAPSPPQSLRQRTLLAIEKPIGLLSSSIFWYLSLHLLRIEGFALSALVAIIQVLLSISLIWISYALCDVATAYFSRLAKKTESPLDDQLVPLFSKTLKVFVVVIGILVSIQNLGFNVMSLLAGLGIGGLAFALAAKDTAANLFGSIMILLDQPFRVGDWIKTNNIEGTVVEIGFRSTRIRTFYDSLISVPNSIIATNHIDNMGRRTYRRVKAILGLTYDTPPEKIEAFLEGVKSIILANPHTRKDYFHVCFNDYGDFSLNILVYYFLDVPTWAQELIEKQNIFLEIYRLAQELEVSFAFPTQTLHVESLPGQEKPQQKPKSPEELKNIAHWFSKNGKLAKPEGLGIFRPPYMEN